MPANDVLLEARGIGRRLANGNGWLLNDVSLAIEPAVRVSLAGPSGAGKTLLLRALAMLDPLDSGQIRWHGRAVRCQAVPAFRREVIYLHQRPALLGDTVEAALRRPFELAVHRHRRFDADRVVDLLGQLEREPTFLQKQVPDLSGGEIQITALVRAVQLDPAVLLLDEPTAALDSQAAAAMERLVGRWIEDAPAARAFVWVSHDAQQAQRVAGKTLLMQAGTIVR